MFPFEELESQFVVLVVPEREYAGLAVVLSNLCSLVDPNIDEEELHDEFFDIITECEGEITWGDIKTCVALAKATKFDKKWDRWN